MPSDGLHDRKMGSLSRSGFDRVRVNPIDLGIWGCGTDAWGSVPPIQLFLALSASRVLFASTPTVGEGNLARPHN